MASATGRGTTMHEEQLTGTANYTLLSNMSLGHSSLYAVDMLGGLTDLLRSE